MNIAILLSGGTGTRLKSECPKQYIDVAGKMLITYSLEVLIKSPHIDAIQIVAEPEWKERIVADAEKYNLCTDKVMDFAMPGANRQASILSGLESILWQREIGMEDTVLIHDAARPNLTEEMIEECLQALQGHDGVMPVLPMKDTVYLSTDGKRVSELLDRSRIFAGQAPELFRLKKYHQANTSLPPDVLSKINGSTEPAVLAGMDIVMIPGHEENYKITTNADLERFREAVGAGGD